MTKFKETFQDEIRITITFKSAETSNAVNARNMRIMDVYVKNADNEFDLVFSETESCNWKSEKTRHGVAGAVNLLYKLLLEHENVYYINDYQKLSNEMAEKFCRSSRNCTQNNCCISKRFHFFRKLRFQFLKLKLKFFNVFK